jgi:cytochrome c oxidase subunit 2
MNGQGQSKRRRTVVFRSITIVSLLAIAAMALGPYAVGAENPYSTISPKSNTANDIQFLYKVVFWLALVVFVGIQFGIAFTALRYRRRHDDEPRPEQIHGNKTLEIVWTIIPAVILIAIFIPTVRTLYDFDAKAQAGDYEIQVYGKQWWWEVHYAKPDNVANVITANEIYIPVGRTIQISLYSNNVIHSFWVPQLSGKMDVIPGHANKIGFTAKQPGVFYGECAEYCGDSHALMRFKVIVVDQASFDQWVAGWNAGPSSQALAVTSDITKVPAAAGLCLGCHRINGTNASVAPVGLDEPASTDTGGIGPAKYAGPNLSDFACRTTIGAGALPNDEAHLREWLNDPGAVKPGNYMATQITKGLLNTPTADPNDDPNRTNLDVIVDYLKSLHPENGCVPLTGINAGNVVQLANDGQTPAATGATTDDGASTSSDAATNTAASASTGPATDDGTTAATGAASEIGSSA